MVWAGLSIYGSTKPFFLGKKETVNTANYTHKILPFAKNEGQRLFGRRQYIFQQDGAPAHTANKSQKWCEKNFPKFIPKQKWPPNSPDLNPLDYYFWNAVVTRMNTKKIKNREDLIKEIENGFEKVPIWEIRSAICRFNKRLREAKCQKEGEEGH